MGKNELTRMYYLICELRPELPPPQLLNLLPNKITDFFEGAKKHGIGSGDSNSAQLTRVYMDGSSSGIDPTESEFKGLICSEIRQALCTKDLKLDQYMKLSAMLADYYGNSTSSGENEILPFDADVPELIRFSSGLPALDALCGGGVYKSITTILGDPANGKSSIALWIAANWEYGPVSFFEPNEMGRELMLNKTKAMGIKFKDPKPQFHFGFYTPETILDYIEQNPDPNRLVIGDSLSAMCGLGDSPESRAKYVRFYGDKALKIKEQCKWLLYTTHLKQNASGEGIYDAGGSSVIGKSSRIIVSVRKEELRPNRTNTMSLYSIKDSMGMSNSRQRFEYDLGSNRFIRNLDEETELEDLLDVD